MCICAQCWQGFEGDAITFAWVCKLHTPSVPPPHSRLADVSAVLLQFRLSRILWMMHQATFTSGHSVSRVPQMKHTNWISFTNLLEPLLQGSPSPPSPAPITVDDVIFFIFRQSWIFFIKTQYWGGLELWGMFALLLRTHHRVPGVSQQWSSLLLTGFTN